MSKKKKRIIMNQVKEAEKILETNEFTDSTWTTMSLLVRYYAQIKEYKPKKIRELTEEFFNRNAPYWKEYFYAQELLEKIIKDAKKYPLTQVDEIPITQKELDTVATASSLKLQKILFTFLVLGKFKFIRKGNTWINYPNTTFFKMTNTYQTKTERHLLIHDLKEAKYISLTKSIMDRSYHVEIIDPDGEPVMMVKSLENLGYRWLMYIGKNYAECAECGAMFKPSNNKQKYCKKHLTTHKKSETFICIDCYEAFEVPEGGRKKKRCNLCNWRHRKNYKHQKYLENRKELINYGN